MERIYEGFYFDLDMPDSEFELDISDYPEIKFTEYIVDIQDKLK